MGDMLSGVDCVLRHVARCKKIVIDFRKAHTDRFPVRKIDLTFRILMAVATLPCAVSSLKLHAAPLIGFTSQSWRYYEAGNQPPDNNGVNWKAPAYDDSGWKSGYGFFAHEPDTPQVYNPINTFLTWSNAGAADITKTFYFRTHFNFAGDPTNVFLYFTNV